jgi:surfeit locus 1 family protein
MSGQITGETSVTGLMRMTEPKGGFLRSNDPANERWYLRDVGEISAKRGLSDAAPYFIDAEANSGTGGPVGGLTVVSFPNNHLVYALTWFGLAALLAVWAVVLIRDEHQRRQERVLS